MGSEMCIRDRTKSLTTAASQYGISMGAASRRLSHLREVFDDELFIRSGVTMLPTMRMRRLLPRVLDLLAAGGALLSRDNVGLADSRRIVRLLAADSAVMTVFPLLVRQMAKDAPNASIELNPLSGDFLEQLRAGRADIAVYPLDRFRRTSIGLNFIKAAAAFLYDKVTRSSRNTKRPEELNSMICALSNT